MELSSKGIELLKKEEGVIYYAYYCPANVPTIGVGCRVDMMSKEEESLCEYIPLHEVKVIPKIRAVINGEGLVMTASLELVDQMLKRRLVSFEKTVNQKVKVELKQNEFDALVSFIFNIGITAFNRSTLLKKINSRKSNDEIKYEFMRWINAGGKPILKKRRETEVKLFFEGIY